MVVLTDDASSTMQSYSTRRIVSLTIPLIVLLTYRRAFAAYFLEDDFQWLVSSWYFDPANLIKFSRYNHFYRPSVEVFFYLAVQAFNHSAVLFHAAVILLHAVNGLVVFGLARSISHDERWASFAALLFIVLPGYVDAVAWVGAIAEPLSTLFFNTTLWVFLLYLDSRRNLWRLVAVGTFALALVTHESAATLILMMFLTEWAFGPSKSRSGGRRGLERLGDYAPFLLMLGVYLAIDFGVNRRNYVIADGYYRFGPHIVVNILDYLISLYVGKRILASYIAVTVALAVLLVKGSPRARFASAWILITLMPFALFTWGTTSRYLYLPAVGFSLLLSEGLVSLDRFAARMLPGTWRPVIVFVIFVAIAVRFAVFTSKGVDDFVRRAGVYREYIEAFRITHPRLPEAALVRIVTPTDPRIQTLYLEPLVQWEYSDPSIHLEIVPAS